MFLGSSFWVRDSQNCLARFWKLTAGLGSVETVALPHGQIAVLEPSKERCNQANDIFEVLQSFTTRHFCDARRYSPLSGHVAIRSFLLLLCVRIDIIGGGGSFAPSTGPPVCNLLFIGIPNEVVALVEDFKRIQVPLQSARRTWESQKSSFELRVWIQILHQLLCRSVFMVIRNKGRA